MEDKKGEILRAPTAPQDDKMATAPQDDKGATVLNGDSTHEAPKRSKKNIVIIVILAVLLVLLVGLSIWMIVRKANNQNSTHNNNSDGSTAVGKPDAAGNYTGEGYAVAVFDSGINKNHEAMRGKVIDEICIDFEPGHINAFGMQPESMCPKGAKQVAQKGAVRIFRGEGVASDCSPRLQQTEENVFRQPCLHGR